MHLRSFNGPRFLSAKAARFTTMRNEEIQRNALVADGVSAWAMRGA
jgi:hypothetical protein